MSKRIDRPELMRRMTSLVGFGVLFMVLTAASCTSRGHIGQCDPHHDPSQGSCIQGGVIISFSQGGADPINASTLAITREADPNLLAYGSGSASGVVKITLTDGTKRSYSTSLVYDSSRSASISPATAGHQVYAFVPSNPSSLQAFIDQYRSQTTDLTLSTEVYLDNQSSTSDTATVEIQETHDGSLSFIGSIGVSVGPTEEYKDV